MNELALFAGGAVCRELGPYERAKYGDIVTDRQTASRRWNWLLPRDMLKRAHVMHRKGLNVHRIVR